MSRTVEAGYNGRDEAVKIVPLKSDFRCKQCGTNPISMQLILSFVL